MSEQAPEMVWLQPTGWSDERPHGILEAYSTQYRRADIAWLPEGLVERLHWASDPDCECSPLARDILAAIQESRNE